MDITVDQNYSFNNNTLIIPGASIQWKVISLGSFDTKDFSLYVTRQLINLVTPVRDGMGRYCTVQYGSFFWPFAKHALYTVYKIMSAFLLNVMVNKHS